MKNSISQAPKMQKSIVEVPEGIPKNAVRELSQKPDGGGNDPYFTPTREKNIPDTKPTGQTFSVTKIAPNPENYAGSKEYLKDKNKFNKELKKVSYNTETGDFDVNPDVPHELLRKNWENMKKTSSGGWQKILEKMDIGERREEALDIIKKEQPLVDAEYERLKKEKIQKSIPRLESQPISGVALKLISQVPNLRERMLSNQKKGHIYSVIPMPGSRNFTLVHSWINEKTGKKETLYEPYTVEKPLLSVSHDFIPHKVEGPVSVEPLAHEVAQSAEEKKNEVPEEKKVTEKIEDENNDNDIDFSETIEVPEQLFDQPIEEEKVISEPTAEKIPPTTSPTSARGKALDILRGKKNMEKTPIGKMSEFPTRTGIQLGNAAYDQGKQLLANAWKNKFSNPNGESKYEQPKQEEKKQEVKKPENKTPEQKKSDQEIKQELVVKKKEFIKNILDRDLTTEEESKWEKLQTRNLYAFLYPEKATWDDGKKRTLADYSENVRKIHTKLLEHESSLAYHEINPEHITVGEFIEKIIGEEADHKIAA